jgi:hypothetical protein
MCGSVFVLDRFSVFFVVAGSWSLAVGRWQGSQVSLSLNHEWYGRMTGADKEAQTPLFLN